MPLHPPRCQSNWGPSISVATRVTSSPACCSALQHSIREAQRQGEDTSEFHPICLSVIERREGDRNIRQHNPIPFKPLKELKNSFALLEGISTDALASNDWKMLAKACFSGDDYLLWKSEFLNLCAQQANRNRMHNIPISLDVLTGEGQYSALIDQLQFAL